MPTQGSHAGTGATRQARADVQLVSMDFREVLAGMWQRRLSIVLCGLLAGAVAYGVAAISTAKYTIGAQVLVDNFETPFTRAQPNETAADRRQVDPADVQSQVEVLRSRDIAKQVVEELRLVEQPEFNPSPDEMSALKLVLVALGFSSDPRRQTPQQRALAAYYNKVKVYQIPLSKVIVIEASSRDPRMAAALVNTTAETYVRATRELQSESTGRARTWLSEQIEDLRKKVVESEGAVEEFRARAGLLKGQNASTLNTQELSELSSQIVIAQTQRSEAQTKARAIRDLLSRTGTVDTSIDVLNSALIQRLREQQIALKRTLAQLSTVYLDSHPRIIGVNSELVDLDRQLRSEALKVVHSLEQEAKVAATREGALRAGLAELKSRASGDNQDEVRLRALEREATANRTLLETFLGRFSDASTRQQLDAQPGMARVIARADPPSQPSFPKVGPMVLIGLAGGLTLGLGFAFLAEVMGAASRVFEPAMRANAPPGAEMHVSSSRETPGLALPKTAPASAGPRLSGFDAAANPGGAGQPRDAATSALRSVASWLVSQRQTLGINRYALVSLGGTDALAAGAAVALARGVAGQGIKVIIIDASIADRPLARLFDLGKARGLVDLLAGQATFSDVIVRDWHSGAHVLPAGLGDGAAPALIAGERMAMVLDALDHAYDVVLVHVGTVAQPEPASRGLIARCPGALLFAPAARSRDAAAILAHLQRLGARATRIIKVEAGAPRSGEPMSAPLAANG